MKIRLLGNEKLKKLLKEFPSLIFTDKDDYDILLWHLGRIDTILKKSIVLFNSDENILQKNIQAYVISYGHNTKSTITISSMDERKIMICTQRKIRDIYGNVIEPQEFQVDYNQTEGSSSEILACFSLALVCGYRQLIKQNNLGSICPPF